MTCFIQTVRANQIFHAGYNIQAARLNDKARLRVLNLVTSEQNRSELIAELVPKRGPGIIQQARKNILRNCDLMRLI